MATTQQARSAYQRHAECACYKVPATNSLQYFHRAAADLMYAVHIFDKQHPIGIHAEADTHDPAVADLNFAASRKQRPSRAHAGANCGSRVTHSMYKSCATVQLSRS